MVIKQRTFTIICSAIALFLIAGTLGYTIYEQRRKDEKAKQEMIADYERAVNREYKSLVSEYESIVETLNDYDYSYSFRYKYINKLNKLLGYTKYSTSGFEVSSVNQCIEDLQKNKEDDLKLLRSIARIKVLED